jgi:hypothetical protein
MNYATEVGTVNEEVVPVLLACPLCGRIMQFTELEQDAMPGKRFAEYGFEYP